MIVAFKAVSIIRFLPFVSQRNLQHLFTNLWTESLCCTKKKRRKKYKYKALLQCACLMYINSDALQEYPLNDYAFEICPRIGISEISLR
jgi:hypothetical protein